MKKETLLEKAKAIGPGRKKWVEISEELVELALAWANDEISYAQVLRVLKKDYDNRSTAYITLARALKKAIKEN